MESQEDKINIERGKSYVWGIVSGLALSNILDFLYTVLSQVFK